jgi:homoserine dehydrogenase
MVEMNRYNLCFLGFGNVGRALVALLAEKTDELRARYGIEWRITGVATRRMGRRVAPAGFDPQALLRGEASSQVAPPADVPAWLRAAGCDVLFETTALDPHAGQPAIEHIRAALAAGAHVVTANKGPVVYACEELIELARSRGRLFLFEATVADCLPVFSLFRETLPAARVLAFGGVLNSTTNVILDAMGEGLSFAAGVRRAQELGVAETDPSNDVDGWDAAVKVCALARMLLRTPLRPDEIEREGIRGLTVAAVQAARAEGRPYRLVARARYDDGRLCARVRPERIAADDPLALARGTSLLLRFELDVLPGLVLMAERPNLKSTAYGLLADFINAVK